MSLNRISRDTNDVADSFEAIVYMGSVEPQQKKLVTPVYSGSVIGAPTKFDDLQLLGVFKRAEDVKVTAEYLNPSFVEKKPNGGSRIVTAFTDVRRYYSNYLLLFKPQASLIPKSRFYSTLHGTVETSNCNRFYKRPLSNSTIT